MSGVLIHDSRRSGHKKWSVEAVTSGYASGIILTPFATPRVGVPRNPSAADFAKEIKAVGGEVIFDPMTHARLLPGTNKTAFYDTWGLWKKEGKLASEESQLTHVERVFGCQEQINAPFLAPTLQLSSPQSSDANLALDMAQVAQRVEKKTWQSLVGTRSFWASGPHLDAYVGSLSALRAPVWMITVANEIVSSQTPDLTDTKAFAGLCRTVHSLSLRARVIFAFSDFSGLPAVAAGADTLGSGWDRGQRTFDPLSYQENSATGPRRPASYVTQGGLNAVLRRDAAEAINRWDATQATRIRGDSMPPSDNIERMHHLQQLHSAVETISANDLRNYRVDALRIRYSTAAKDFDTLINSLPNTVKKSDKESWVTAPSKIIEEYAFSEGF